MMSETELVASNRASRRRIQQPQQHRKSCRLIRYALFLLLITSATVVLTSSYASANHFYGDVKGMPGTSTVHGQQRMVSVTPDGEETNVPVQIFLRLEDLVRVPCGMARKTNVQLVNTHETEAIRILSVEVLPEGESPTFRKPNLSLETLVDRAISGMNRPRGPERSVFVSSFSDTLLQPGEACIVEIEFVPRCYGKTFTVASKNSIDLQYRNSILLTLIIPSTGKTTKKAVASTGEVVYDGRAVSFQIGGSAIESPLKFPEYILMKSRPKSLNEGYAHEVFNSSEGNIAILGNYGETPIDFGAFSSTNGNITMVNLTTNTASNQVYDHFFEASIRMKKVKDKPDILVPYFVWEWKDPFDKPIQALSDFIHRREVASILMELKEKVKNGIVRWGEVRLQLNTGEIVIIEIRLHLKKVYHSLDRKALMLEGENARVTNMTLLAEYFHTAITGNNEKLKYSNGKRAPPSVASKLLEPSDSGLFTVISKTRSSDNFRLLEDFSDNHALMNHQLTKVNHFLDFGTLWASTEEGSRDAVVSSDVFHVGIRNREDIAVKVLRVEQTEYSFQSLESPSTKVFADLLRGENKYLKIHTPSSLSAVIISPKETVPTLVELRHLLPPQSALLMGKIRFTTNHFNEEFEFLDVSYRVRILRGHLDLDYESSTGGLDNKDKFFDSHLSKKGGPGPMIWWNVLVSSSTLERTHQATKRLPSSLPAFSQNPLVKRLRLYNSFTLPLQIKSIELSDSCSGVAQLWILPAHPFANGTRCLAAGNYRSIESHNVCSRTRHVDWGIIPGFGGTWSDFIEIELFAELNSLAKNNSFNVTRNFSTSSGIPFICHLFLSNNLTSYALPIVLYDLGVHYSPRVKWDAPVQQQSISNDAISQTGTRFASVFHGTMNSSILFENQNSTILSKEEEYMQIIKQGWQILNKINDMQQPCFDIEEEKALLEKRRVRRFTRIDHLASNARTEGIPNEQIASDNLEHLNVDIGSLPADGSFHTASFYVTNLNPVPIEIEARGSFDGMKLQMGSKTANIVNFLPKKNQNYEKVYKKEALDEIKDERFHFLSLEKGSESNFDFITSSKTSVLAKLRRQYDVTFSPMLLPSNLESITGQKNFSALEISSISQVWEILYKKRNMVTLFRSEETNQTQNPGLADYLIPWNEFCKQNSSFQMGGACASCGKPLFGCLLSADDKGVFVLKPFDPSGSHVETKTSWHIPSGGVARIELAIYTPHHSLLNRDVSRLSVFGLRLFNKATKNEMPVVVNYHAIRGCLFLRALSSNRFIAQTDFSRIHVPCLLFTDSSWSKNIVTNSVQQSLQNNHYLSPPLELVSTFSNAVRLISTRSKCTPLFQFETTFNKDIPPDGSGVGIGHVRLNFPCNATNVAGPSTSFNYYSCANSWLLFRYSMISCKNSESVGENSVPESETTVIFHALRLSGDLMHHMSERFGDFYSKLERVVGNNTQLHHVFDNSSGFAEANFTNVEPNLSERMAMAQDSYLSSGRWVDAAYSERSISVVSPPLHSISEPDIINLSNAPSSPPVFVPSVREDTGGQTRSTLSDLLLKINAFNRIWHQGVQKFNWDSIEDEVEMKVAVLQEDLLKTEKSTVWKEIAIRAAAFPLNITAGTESAIVKLHSSISFPRVSTTTSASFFYSKPLYKKVDAEVTPVSFVSEGYIIVRNPAAVPIRVRIVTVDSDANGKCSGLNQGRTELSAYEYGGKVFEMHPSATYAQDLGSAIKLDTSKPLGSDIPNSFLSSPTTSASTSSWWNGGSYFSYSLKDNSLLQASHNITIRSAGGAHVSLINPSMQAVNALSIGCGQRCGLRHEMMTAERYEAPLGAVSSSNLDWIKRGSVLSTSNPAVFSLPLPTQAEKVVPPLASMKLGPILFRPSGRGLFSGCLMLENSLSGAEFIDMVGIGGVEELRMESWRIEDDAVSYEQYVPPFRSTVSLEFRSRKNPYTVGVSNIENRYNHPTLVFSGTSNPHTHSSSVKTIHVTNSGDIPVSIERVYLGSSEVIHHTKLRPHPDDYKWFFSHAKEGCEYNGFRILGCVTSAEESNRAERFEKSFFSPVRRWFIGKEKVSMFDALPENTPNTAQGFNLLPGESTQIHVAHVADCSFQKMYATLHLQYRGRSSISLNHEAKPWRQGFQSHEETLLIGYEMTSSEFNECQIAKPRAQGLIFSKSGRDPIGMHVRGEYPIAYYAIDSLFNWMARRYSAGSSNVPADYAYLFVYTASMFVEHSTVALLVSIAFLLFFHALIFLFDRMSQSKAFRDMWKENISLRESIRVGWRNMLLLGRSDANHANVDALIHATHDVVKAGTINALKLSSTVAGGAPLLCLTSGGGFVARACPNSSALTVNSGKVASCHTMDHRSISSRAKQQTLSDAIFWQLECNAFLGLLPAGLGWRQVAAASPDVFYETFDSTKQESTDGHVCTLLLKRETEAGSPNFTEREVEIEISFNNEDAHSVLGLEDEDFDVVSLQEDIGSELDESSSESGEEEDDVGINADLTSEDMFQALGGLESIDTIELKRISSTSPNWCVQGNTRKIQESNAEIVVDGDSSKTSRHESGAEPDEVNFRPARVKQSSTSLSPNKDRGRFGEYNKGKGNSDGAVMKRRVVTSRVAMSLEKRAPTRPPINAWRMPSTPPKQGALSQTKMVLHHEQSAGSSSSMDSQAESPSLPGSSLNSNSPSKSIISSSEANSPAVRIRTHEHSSSQMKSSIPPLPLVPASNVDSLTFLEAPEPCSPSLMPSDLKKGAARPPPGLAPPPGFEGSPLFKAKPDEGLGESDILSNELLPGHRKVGTLASDPWANLAGVDFIQSFTLGPSSLLNQTCTSNKHPDGRSGLSTTHQNIKISGSSEVIIGNNIIGQAANVNNLPHVSTIGNTSLHVGGVGLGDLGLNNYSSMGLFNVENFLGFLDEDDNQVSSHNAEDRFHSKSSSLISLVKNENVSFEDKNSKDLWDPSSGEIISPTQARARALVSTAIGGERSTSLGSTGSPIPSSWIRNRDEVGPISGLGSSLLTPDMLKDSSDDIDDTPVTKRNPFFAHWMSEAS